MIETLLALTLVLINDQIPVAEAQYIPPKVAETVVVTPQKQEGIECLCVTFARQFVPSLPRGDAKFLIPNSMTPEEGGAVILQHNERHVGAVLKVTEMGIHIIESNFKKCKVTMRTIPLGDPSIVGYWNPL